MESVTSGLPAGQLVVPTAAAAVVTTAAVIASPVIASPVIAAESETERQRGITPVVRPRVVIAVVWCRRDVNRRGLSIDWCRVDISGRGLSHGGRKPGAAVRPIRPGSGWGGLRGRLRHGLCGGCCHVLPGGEQGGQHLIGHTLPPQIKNFGHAQVVDRKSTRLN